MMWETMTARPESPSFVFNVGQPTGEHQDVEKPDKVEVAQGPMAMCYKEDVGWIAECLGPMSRHWKRKARKI